jgi:hypothetical protein
MLLLLLLLLVWSSCCLSLLDGSTLSGNCTAELITTLSTYQSAWHSCR